MGIAHRLQPIQRNAYARRGFFHHVLFSPRTCWKTATSFAPCRSCSDTHRRRHDDDLHPCLEHSRPRRDTSTCPAADRLIKIVGHLRSITAELAMTPVFPAKTCVSHLP